MCFRSAVIAIHGIQAGANGSSCPWTHNWGAWGRLPQWRNKTGLEEKDSFGKRMKQQPEKSGSERQNMFGKCSTTCLQIIINILEPSQSHGCGADASGAIPFHWQMWFCSVLLCLFTCFLIANRTWGRLRKHMLPKGQQAHTLSAGEMQQCLDMMCEWMDLFLKQYHDFSRFFNSFFASCVWMWY